MKKPIKSLRRKNPTEITNGIKWYYQSENYINTPKDFKVIVEKVIYEFGKILKQKLPVIINKVPMIVIEDLMFNKYNGLDHSLAAYDSNNNVIYLNGNKIKSEISKCDINKFVRYLHHELGHFVYKKYLSEESLERFEEFIDDNMSFQNINVLIYYSKFPNLKEKYPIYYIIIETIIWQMIRNGLKVTLNFTKDLENFKKIYSKTTNSKSMIKYKDNFYVFGKPTTSYMPFSKDFHTNSKTIEEIFCECFSYYMMFGLKEMHSANFTILQTILPELK